MMHTSQAAPLKTSAIGLYLRLWDHAALPDLGFDAPARRHYEAIAGSQIDDHEKWLRHRLRRDWRSLPRDIEHIRGCPHTQRRLERRSASATATRPPPNPKERS